MYCISKKIVHAYGARLLFYMFMPFLSVGDPPLLVPYIRPCTVT